MPHIDLLNPEEHFQRNYKNQIKRTIEAYSIGHVVISEALQNSLDAVARTQSQTKTIDIEIDFDARRVSITDNGNGFPADPSLLILGGSDKARSSRTVAGQVGVGIKVVLFCTKVFEVRSKTEERAWKLEISDGNTYLDEDVTINVPHDFPEDEDSPHEETGTQVTYEFAEEAEGSNYLRRFMDHVKQVIADPSLGDRAGFPRLVRESTQPAKAAYLIYAYLARFTYAGDTLGALGGRDGFQNLEISLTLRCEDPATELGSFWGEMWGETAVSAMKFEPGYLSVEKTAALRAVRRPTCFTDALGNGGQNLDRTANGFNCTKYVDEDGFKKLLRNRSGNLVSNVEKYERLFEKINCIEVTIGRIPHFEEFLPLGSRRVLSANGVVTGHDVDIVSGRNQQYVRCVDIVLDLDAQLNYGKVHITDGRLVNSAKAFLNDAYRSVLQTAASRFVGRIEASDDDVDEDVFWGRDDLQGTTPWIPITKVPRDENDVIALFASLVTAGTLHDYRILGFSQRDTYDARMLAKRPCDRDDILENPDERDLRTVEFKMTASSVIRDFDSQVKDIRDIHLLVCWDEGSWATAPNYGFHGIEHSAYYRESPQKTFQHATDMVLDNRTGREMQVLVLKKLVNTIGTAPDVDLNPE